MKLLHKIRDWKTGYYMRDLHVDFTPEVWAAINHNILKNCLRTDEDPDLCIVEIDINIRVTRQFPSNPTLPPVDG